MYVYIYVYVTCCGLLQYPSLTVEEGATSKSCAALPRAVGEVFMWWESKSPSTTQVLRCCGGGRY